MRHEPFLDRLTRLTLELRYDAAANRVLLAAHRLAQWLKYNPNWPLQSRGPDGRWIDGSGSSSEATTNVQVADLTVFGLLRRRVLAPNLGIMLCIYDFGGSDFVIQSDNTFGCSGIVHQSAVVPAAGGRSTRLNDN